MGQAIRQIKLLTLVYLDQPASCRCRGCMWGQGESECAAVTHVAGWKRHLRPTLFVQHLERGSCCPTKSRHLWAIPKVFGSCFNRSLSCLGMLKSFPLVSATCDCGPVELMQTASCRKGRRLVWPRARQQFPLWFGGWNAQLWVPVDCVGSWVPGKLYRRDLGFLGYEVLAHGVKVWWKQHCAKLIMSSHVGQPKGQELAQVGQSIEMGDVSNAWGWFCGVW